MILIWETKEPNFAIYYMNRLYILHCVGQSDWVFLKINNSENNNTWLQFVSVSVFCKCIDVDRRGGFASEVLITQKFMMEQLGKSQKQPLRADIIW